MSKNPSRPLRAAALNRRELLGRAANAAAFLVVSQAMPGCSSDAVDGAGNDTTTLTPSCVLTASLTEGPYFVDEKLLRADIRTDPATGGISAGTPLTLGFNVMRVASTGCTALTGAYLDVWHCDAAGVYSDVSGAGSGRRFLRGYQLTDANGAVQFTTVYPLVSGTRCAHPLQAAPLRRRHQDVRVHLAVFLRRGHHRHCARRESLQLKGSA